MPLNLLEKTGIAAQIDAAWHAGRPIPPPAELAMLSLREAYEIQDAVVGYREAAGARRSGWKLGLTSSVKQRLMGIDHPLFGRIFAQGAAANESPVAHADFIAPRAEPELAFGLCATLDPQAHPTTYLNAIAWVASAIEITDSRYELGTRSAVELVADNTSSAAYVLGQRVTLGAAPRLDRIETQIVCNGIVLASGTTADVLGNPLVALRLLVANLAQRGLRATAGDVILSGAITDAFPAARGDRFEAHLRGLDMAAVQFV